MKQYEFYDIDEFAIVPVEKKPPYAVGTVYTLDDIDMEDVDEQITKLLRLYQKCRERDYWPSYPDRVEYISIPKWAWKQVDSQTGRIETMTKEIQSNTESGSNE